MTRKPSYTPAYRLHRPSGRAVVTINGRDIYLGDFDSPESHQAYDRIIGEWLAGGRRLTSEDRITVVELICRYLDHVDGQYRSNEPKNIRDALNPLRELYGPTVAEDFGPPALKAVRKRFLDAKLVRTQVNRRTQRIVAAFKWAVSEQLIPSSVWEALRSVSGIRKGAAGTIEAQKVRPVHDRHVDATLPYLSRHVRTMVELQRLTGARPGEVCQMRTIDINTSGKVWEYRPENHKTDHLDKQRVIFIGPAAQEVLKPWLRIEPEAYLFQPREAEGERMVRLRAARKTKVQPSQVDRSNPQRRRELSDHYTPGNYRQAIARGVQAANQGKKPDDPTRIPDWHPHQLRHTAATRLRREFGLDTARAVLGHTSPAVTEIYAELDEAKAKEAMPSSGRKPGLQVPGFLA
jgi:integrase